MIKSSLRALQAGFRGNVAGDGTLLGSTIVVGPGHQGILFEHHSKEFGDHAELKDVMDAARKIVNNDSD